MTSLILKPPTAIRGFLFGLVLFLPAMSYAGVNVQTVRPKANASYLLNEDALLVVNPTLKGSERPGPFVNFQIDSVYQPLVQFDAAGKNKQVIVSNLTNLDLGFGYLVAPKIFLFFDTSVGLVKFGGGGGSVGMSDSRLMAKYRLFGKEAPVAISLVPYLILPTGNSSLYLSDSSFGPGFTIAGEKVFNDIRVVANVGAIYKGGASLQTLDHRFSIPLSLGARYDYNADWLFNLEAATYFMTSSKNFQLGDLYVGAGYNLAPEALITLGGSLGTVSVDGTVSWRVIAGVKLVPFAGEWEKMIAPPPPEIRNPDSDLAAAPAPRVTQDCGIRPVTNQFFARILDKRERRAHKLMPYKAAGGHPFPVLQLGEMTAMTPGGIPYVKESQIVFAIDVVEMPPKNSIVSVDTLALKMSLRKLAKDKHSDSELLCFLDEKICSGDTYRDSARTENVNFAFFQGKETPNDFFTRQFIDRVVGKVGEQSIYASEVTLELSKLLENSLVSDPVDILYGKTDEFRSLKKHTLYFAVSGDTYVSNDARLVVTVRENTCESQKYRQEEEPSSEKESKPAKTSGGEKTP